MSLHIKVDDNGLEYKFGLFLRRLPDINSAAVKAIADVGRDLAKSFAPFRLGYLKSAITSEPVVEAGPYSEARVFIRGGTPREHGKIAAAYGIFQEEGFRVKPQHARPYMRPAAGYLEAGGAEVIMDEHILSGLLDSGISAT